MHHGDVRYYTVAPWRLAVPVLVALVGGVAVWLFARLSPGKKRLVTFVAWAAASSVLSAYAVKLIEMAITISGLSTAGPSIMSPPGR